MTVAVIWDGHVNIPSHQTSKPELAITTYYSFCKGLTMTADRRERRVIYKLPDRQRLAELIRLLGARGAREASGRTVCMATLLKIANEFGIELKKGRRPRNAA